MGSRLAKLAGVLYVLSLLLPALAVVDQPLLGGPPSEKLLWGIHCLAVGWVCWPGWLANPVLLVALIVYDRGRFDAGRYAVAACLCGVALVSALLGPFLLVDQALMTLRYAHVGYFVWIASIVALGLAALVRGATSRDP